MDSEYTSTGFSFDGGLVAAVNGWTTASTMTTATSAGTSIILTRSNDTSEKKSPSGLTPTKGIHPKLIFKFVKSKLTKIEQAELKKKLDKLAPMLNYAKELQQSAIYEDCAKKILEIVREQEAATQGIETIIQKKDIEKLIYNVRDKVIKFKEFSEFPRVVPKKVRTVLKNLQTKKIFDNYMILYTDFSKPEEEIKSTKQKVKEKDPILFGVFNDTPNKLYFIIDWEDEYCDLTLDKLVDNLTELDPDYQVEEVPTITQAYIKELKEEIKKKHNRLINTNPSNYRELMAEEDKDGEQRALIADKEPTKPVKLPKTFLERLLTFWK